MKKIRFSSFKHIHNPISGKRLIVNRIVINTNAGPRVCKSYLTEYSGPKVLSTKPFMMEYYIIVCQSSAVLTL